MARLLALYKEAFQGLSREVWVLSIALFLNRCGTMVVAFLVLYLTEVRGFGEAAAGQFLSLYAVGAMVGVALGGWLVDRVGFRVVLLGSLVLSGIGFMVYGQLRDPWAMRAGIVLMGCFGESFRPANGTAIAVYSAPENRARAFALNRLAINLGWTVAPALAGFLAEMDYGLLFWIDGITCLAAAVFVGLVLPPAVAPKSEAEKPDAPARSPWRDGVFVAFFVLLVLQGLVFFQLQGTWPLYLKSVRDYPESRIGLLFALNALCIVVFEMLLVKRLESSRTLVTMGRACVLLALGFGLMGVSGAVAWVAFLVVLWTAAEMLMFPMSMAWTASRADERSRGAYMAVMGISFSLSMMLAPIWGTWVYEEFGPDTVWWVCLALGLLTSVGFQRLARVER